MLASTRPAPLRIGKVPWHTAHDYELAKMPVEFLVAADTHRVWASRYRPVPANVRFVTSDQLASADLQILHVDQWTLHEIDKLTLLKRGLRRPGPKVVINHGCNLADGCSSEEMSELLGDLLVVCNSTTAQQRWGLRNSVYVRHGMSPEEWPQTNYGRQNIVVTQPSSRIHWAYRNSEAIHRFEQRTGIRIDWIGRDHNFDSFARYRDFLSRSSIYFNPSYASPNPRARTEAMLCGLVPVTTDAHGESEYIVDGENGYCSNDMEELYGRLLELRKDPRKCIRLGLAARRTAQERFHIAGFLAQWREIVQRVLGRSY